MKEKPKKGRAAPAKVEKAEPGGPARIDSVASLRRALNVSQETLARALDVSRGLIAKIEGGDAPVSPKLARRVAKVFSVEVPTGKSGGARKSATVPASVKGGGSGECGKSYVSEAVRRLHEIVRRTDVGISLSGPIGDAEWGVVGAVLGELHRALPDARGFQASFTVVEPEGATPGTVGKMLMLRLGKAEGLQIRPSEDCEDGDLAVDVGGGSKATIHIHWREPHVVGHLVFPPGRPLGRIEFGEPVPEAVLRSFEEGSKRQK
ncbi:MAG TPA: helix-turn-helix transcriptional regulator [Verrucomicrobiae bacterium]|nr:helix-turn-helix transcriptional regulator [Verrucomicrobiae bacterium]